MEMGISSPLGRFYYDSRCAVYLFQKKEMDIRCNSDIMQTKCPIGHKLHHGETKATYANRYCAVT